ncbi:MAG: leucine-rich repeat protein, partial [Clostridia bacterium]|nr:leucine-rich repeat protein [Clostridia bacterium]
QDTTVNSYGILEIHGSVNEGTGEQIVNPVNCQIYGKILVPTADYELYYNSSAWANFRDRLVTSINPVVTFVNTMGGSFDDDTTEYGGVVANPGTPTCDYDSATFLGWYWNDPTQDNASVPFDFSTKLYYNITLYAKWTGIPADRYLEYQDNGDGTYSIVGYDEEVENFSEVIIPSYHPDDHGKITRIAPHTFDMANIQALVFIPGSDIKIDNYAFMNCYSLTSVDLNGANYIGNCAFMNCSRLTELTIPASVAYVGNSAFANCTHLTTVTWESGDNILAGDSGGFIDREGNIGINTSNNSFNPNYWTSWWSGKYINGDYSYLYQTSLETNIFANCKRLTTVTLPDNMYVIPTRMFNNCPTLTTINLGADLYRIGTHAFENCTALQTIILPDNLQEIGNFAFENCDLRTITIPLNVNKIGYNPFLKNKKMEYIYVDSLNESYTSMNGMLCYIDGDTSFSLVAMPEKLVTAQLDFDEFVEPYVDDFMIYNYALAYNNTIKSVTFPSTTHVRLGRSSFYNCAKLAVVMFNSEYVYFHYDGDYQEAFYGCNKLAIVMFKSEVSSVPSANRLSDVFDQPSNQITVYVPTNNYDDFTSSQWAMFTIVKFDATANDI